MTQITQLYRRESKLSSALKKLVSPSEWWDMELEMFGRELSQKHELLRRAKISGEIRDIIRN